MQYWLFKSEPSTWSWDDHMAAKNHTSEWDGVRNYQARNNMMAMKKGDIGLFYHSVKNPQVVGVVEVVREHYPDHTAGEDDRWRMVDLKGIKTLNKPVLLKQIKEHPGLENMVLVKQGRLSVSPVTKKEFDIILKLGETSL